MSDPAAVTDEDIAQSRANPHLRQALLEKSLERLLATMHRLQNSRQGTEPAGARQLREGAIMAAQLADLIRTSSEKLRKSPDPG